MKTDFANYYLIIHVELAPGLENFMKIHPTQLRKQQSYAILYL